MTIFSDHHLLPMSPCILHWDSNQCMKQLNVDITKTSAICNNKIKKLRITGTPEVNLDFVQLISGRTLLIGRGEDNCPSM